MRTLYLPEPTKKQKQFLMDEHPYVAYGGSRGGGKSWAVRIDAIMKCLQYPGLKVMIVRKTYPELQENHIKPMIEMTAPSECRSSSTGINSRIAELHAFSSICMIIVYRTFPVLQ